MHKAMWVDFWYFCLKLFFAVIFILHLLNFVSFPSFVELMLATFYMYQKSCLYVRIICYSQLHSPRSLVIRVLPATGGIDRMRTSFLFLVWISEKGASCCLQAQPPTEDWEEERMSIDPRKSPKPTHSLRPRPPAQHVPRWIKFPRFLYQNIFTPCKDC